MEREEWMRGGMVLSILALVVLIVVTPSLLGRPSTELTSVPQLVIGLSRNESRFIVQLGWAIQAYRYDVIRLSINESVPSVNRTVTVSEAYGLSESVPGNVSFSVNVYFVDRDRYYFEYNVTAHRETIDNRTALVITFPYEPGNRSREVRYADLAEDFRQSIPRRGRLP